MWPFVSFFFHFRRFSHVWLCATLWTVARQAPLSMWFSRQEYPSGLPFPSPWSELVLYKCWLFACFCFCFFLRGVKIQALALRPEFKSQFCHLLTVSLDKSFNRLCLKCPHLENEATRISPTSKVNMKWDNIGCYLHNKLTINSWRVWGHF